MWEKHAYSFLYKILSPSRILLYHRGASFSVNCQNWWTLPLRKWIILQLPFNAGVYLPKKGGRNNNIKKIEPLEFMGIKTWNALTEKMYILFIFQAVTCQTMEFYWWCALWAGNFKTLKIHLKHEKGILFFCVLKNKTQKMCLTFLIFDCFYGLCFKECI